MLWKGAFFIVYNPYDYYITPEEYAEAERNGIHARLLEVRIRRLGWEKGRAIITPPRVRKLTDPELRSLAKAQGISYNTFWHRIYRGWDEKRAANTTLQEAEEQRKDNAIRVCKMNRKYPQELVDLAAKNGICYGTFYGRVNYSKWDLNTVATKPVSSSNGINRTKELYGENFYRIRFRI